MSKLSNFVSLHPYFNVRSGKLDAVKAAFPRFLEKTATEEMNLFYKFTVKGDDISAAKGTPMPRAFSRNLDNIGQFWSKC